jgi:hypothetical protein
MSVPPQATASNPHTHLLNEYIQIANKMRFQHKKLSFDMKVSNKKWRL